MATETRKPYITPETKSLINSRIDRVRLLSYLKAENIRTFSNGQIRCTCPIHKGDNESSFVLFPDTNWVCNSRHCDENMKQDLISLVRRVLGCNFYESIKLLSDMAGVPIDFDEESSRYNKDAVENFNWANFVKKNDYKREVNLEVDAAMVRRMMLDRTDYMQKRGFEEWALNDFEVGHAIDWKGYEGEERVTFPIKFEGRYVGLQGRAVTGKGNSKKFPDDPWPRDKKYDNLKDFIKTNYLYNFDRAMKIAYITGRIIVCEGVTDVIWLHQHGLGNAVCTLGSSISKEHIKLLCRGNVKVVLMFDADKAGGEGMELFWRTGRHFFDIEHARLPDGKDPAECSMLEIYSAYSQLTRKLSA